MRYATVALRVSTERGATRCHSVESCRENAIETELCSQTQTTQHTTQQSNSIISVTNKNEELTFLVAVVVLFVIAVRCFLHYD
jgi:hypothetical protein